jgi:predicted enzyme related to lactoylglutathione lyase
MYYDCRFSLIDIKSFQTSFMLKSFNRWGGSRTIGGCMRINLSSIMVDDQEKALKFYTEKLGFVKKTDMAIGEYRWLTVTSPEGADGVELVLEPMGFPPARDYQKALYAAGIPITAFLSSDIQAEYKHLIALGVVFRSEPQTMGSVTSTLFEDTCGNLINLVEPAK